jgi:hypothetical protein
MLLFKPEHQEPILSRTKTQTRRVWKKKRANVGSIHLAKTKMLSKEYFAKLEIQAVYQERLIDISEEDAIAEGYPDSATYLTKFCEINKLKFLPTDLITWVVKFRVVA